MGSAAYSLTDLQRKLDNLNGTKYGQTVLGKDWFDVGYRIMPGKLIGLRHYFKGDRYLFKVEWPKRYNEAVKPSSIYKDTDENRKLMKRWNELEEQQEKLRKEQES